MLISLYFARVSQATLAVNIVTSSNVFVQKKITGFTGCAEVGNCAEVESAKAFLKIYLNDSAGAVPLNFANKNGR